MRQKYKIFENIRVPLRKNRLSFHKGTIVVLHCLSVEIDRRFVETIVVP